MDALLSDGIAPAGPAAQADRRPSVTRLAAGLHGHAGPGDLLAPLCIPLALLLSRHLRFDAADPLWADRDRLVLIPDAAPLGETAARLLETGRGLYQVSGAAIGTATGMAMAERALAARFGRSLVDHRTWVLSAGPGLATGSVQEAASLAGVRRLGRLAVVHAMPAAGLPLLSGFVAKGWAVRRAAAGDAGAIASAMSAALRSLKPTLIAIIGAEEAPVREAFAGPGLTWDARAAWQSAGSRAAGLRRAWLKRLARHAARVEFDQTFQGRLPARWHAVLAEPVASAGQAERSTAAAVQDILPRLMSALPELACLPGAPPWKLPGPQAELGAGSSEAAGLLTQAVTLALCGMAEHGGLLPFAAHPLGDLDTVRPALREAAIRGLHLIQMLVEPATGCPAAGQRTSLRAMRNVFVFRPAESSEAMECLELALRRTAGPSVLLLSEAPAPALSDRPARTRSARGGYLVAEPAGARDATLIASGADLHVAARARALLSQAGLSVALVSLPCWDLFAQQDAAWQARVLGAAPRIGIEAGSGFGWERWLGALGLFIDSSSAAVAPEGHPPPGPARRIADAILRHLGHLGRPPAD